MKRRIILAARLYGVTCHYLLEMEMLISAGADVSYNACSACMQECYRCLPDKTLAFLIEVNRKWDAKWIAKIDDDVYLTPNRLLRAVPQWDSINADYVGCMKSNDVCTVPRLLLWMFNGHMGLPHMAC